MSTHRVTLTATVRAVLLGLLATSLVLLLSHTARAQGNEEQKLLASDGSVGDYFGRAVAIDGDVAVVGAFYDDDTATNAGAAYVYRRSGSSWSFEQKLLASDGAASDEFGLAVAVHGDVIVVGSHLADPTGSQSGAVYIFRFDGTSWLEERKLEADDGGAGDEFGISVAVHGDHAVIGAYLDDDKGTNSGSVYVYEHVPFVGWILDQKIVALDGQAYDGFGRSLSLDGTKIAVGARGDDDMGTDAGAAYIYVENGSGWDLEQKLTASDGVWGDLFGTSVSIDGDWLVVGAPNEDDMAGDAGAAYVFHHDGAAWGQDQKLTARDGENSDYFGYCVAISGDLIVVGAYAEDGSLPPDQGSGYLYKRCGSWVHWKKIAPSDAAPADLFAYSVALDAGTAIAGSSLDDDNGYNSGAAYVFNAAQELNLEIDPTSVSAGDTIDFTISCGWPGDPVALFVVAVNGVPFYKPVIIHEFGPDHKFSIHSTVPPGFSGLIIDFQAFKPSACGGLAESSVVTVTFL